MVNDYLVSHPDDELSATAIGKALGRSSGAVSNALGRLVQSGGARLVSSSPRRYGLSRR